MGPYSEDSHLGWASKLLGIISLLSEWPGIPGREGNGRNWESWKPLALGGFLVSDVFTGKKEKIICCNLQGVAWKGMNGKKEMTL
jgi:hypothetical protein